VERKKKKDPTFGIKKRGDWFVLESVSRIEPSTGLVGSVRIYWSNGIDWRCDWTSTRKTIHWHRSSNDSMTEEAKKNTGPGPCLPTLTYYRTHRILVDPPPNSVQGRLRQAVPSVARPKDEVLNRLKNDDAETSPFVQGFLDVLMMFSRIE
jgi:hypothetical protein